MKKRENFYSKLFMEEKMAIKNCLRMVLIILLLGITVVGFNSCSKNMDNRLSGTWVRTNDSGSEVKVSYKSGNYEFTVDGIPDEKGTFTTSDGKIFYNITHLYGTELELDSKWYSKNELQTALKDVEWAKEFLSEINSPFVHEYTINGNTYTSINARGREWTYTKISDSKKNLHQTSKAVVSFRVHGKAIIGMTILNFTFFQIQNGEYFQMVEMIQANTLLVGIK